jgi:hypothetical protein
MEENKSTESSELNTEEIVFTAKIKMVTKGNRVFTSIVDIEGKEIAKIGHFRQELIADHKIEGVEASEAETIEK